MMWGFLEAFAGAVFEIAQEKNTSSFPHVAVLSSAFSP
jgi:hypothetical protein